MLVTTAAPHEGSLPRTLTAYGTVQAAPGNSETLSLLRAGQVTRVLVTPGQAVRQGQPLLVVSADPAALAAFRQAVTALTLAQGERGRVAQMLAQHLATRDQLAQADKAVTDAQGNLDVLTRAGGGSDGQTVAAPFDGVVSSLPVATGARIASQAPLVTLDRSNSLVAAVGMEPAQRGLVAEGQPARIEPLDGTRSRLGSVLGVGGMLDPATRLVPVLVSPQADQPGNRAAAGRRGAGCGAGGRVSRLAGAARRRLDGCEGALRVPACGRQGGAGRCAGRGRRGRHDGRDRRARPQARPGHERQHPAPGWRRSARGSRQGPQAGSQPMSDEALRGPAPKAVRDGGWVARHTRSILAVMLALMLAGGFSAVLLPTGLFPVVQFPRVVVNMDAGARPADQTALLVTVPLEQATRRVLGVQGVRSTTSRGSAEVSLDFAWGTDMVAAAVQVDAAVAQVLPALPAGSTYQVRRMDPTVFPVIAYSLMSKNVARSSSATSRSTRSCRC